MEGHRRGRQLGRTLSLAGTARALAEAGRTAKLKGEGSGFRVSPSVALACKGPLNARLATGVGLSFFPARWRRGVRGLDWDFLCLPWQLLLASEPSRMPGNRRRCSFGFEFWAGAWLYVALWKGQVAYCLAGLGWTGLRAW
jgi:hypothetical protein